MAVAVTFGEALLRLSPPGRLRLEQARTLEMWPGGAELNVAVGLARLGTETAWISVVPHGPLGELVLAHARAHGVGVAGVARTEGRLGLYFVEPGEPPLAPRALYDRAGSAFAALEPASLDWAELLAGAAVLHVTGIAAAVGPACARAVADALSAARTEGCHSSYDLNLRTLMGAPEEWRRRLEQVAPALDTLLLSLDDASAVFGLEGDPEDLAARLRTTLGVERVILSQRVPADGGLRREVVCVDAAGATTTSSPVFAGSEPVGAGDAFAAGFLHGLLTSGAKAGLELGAAMAAVKQAVPGDAPVIGREDLYLAGEARMRR